jgi:hypothetical protein
MWKILLQNASPNRVLNSWPKTEYELYVFWSFFMMRLLNALVYYSCLILLATLSWYGSFVKVFLLLWVSNWKVLIFVANNPYPPCEFYRRENFGVLALWWYNKGAFIMHWTTFPRQNMLKTIEHGILKRRDKYDEGGVSVVLCRNLAQKFCTFSWKRLCAFLCLFLFVSSLCRFCVVFVQSLAVPLLCLHF